MNTPVEWSTLIDAQQAQVEQHPIFKGVAKVLSITGKISPTLTGKWLNSLWFKPQPMPLKPDDREWLEKAKIEWIHYKDQRVPIYRWGNGPAVLCVHGWGGHSGQFTPLIKKLVDEGYQVIAFDAPAHGQAEGKRTDLTEFSDLVEIIIRGENSPIHIIAHSMGGVASIDAINRGSATLSLTLIGTPLSLNYIINVTQSQMRLDRKIIDAHKHLMSKDYGNDVWDRFDLLQTPKEFGIPLLLIYDKDDTQILFEVSQSLRQHWPKAEHFDTQGLGHNRLVRDNDVGTKIQRFLSTQTETRSLKAPSTAL